MYMLILLSSFLFGEVGITDYHNADIKGDGVTIGLIDSEPNNHSSMSLEVLDLIAPEAKVTYKTYSQENLDALLDKDIIVSPLMWHRNLVLPDEHPLLLTSAGNFQSGYPATDDRWVSVGAYAYGDLCINECKPQIIDYETDADVYGLTAIPTSYGRYGGTSAASVSLAGMAALMMSNGEDVSFSEEPFILQMDDPVSFTDTEQHWAEEQILRQADLGIMTGYSDGSFRPEQPVTRAELAVIIDRLIAYME